MVYDDTLHALGSAPRRIGGSLAAGQIVGERYCVGQLLGSGGMGLVFEGTHIELGSPVAIKVVRPQFAQDSHILERFVNEARNVAALTSPHIARVFDAGKLRTGEAYLVMERLVGQDLASLLAQSGPLPWPLAVSYVAQACDGLAEAHAHGVVHRDLKPEHLFIVESSASQPLVKILDFGISKNIHQSEARMTLPGDSIGSPLYMSPEQVQNPALVDERTDVWSLGVVLYEAVTGRLPFNGETVAQVQWQVIAEDPEPLTRRCPDAPPALEAVVLRCLGKSPAERFQSVDELRQALRNISEVAEPVAAPPTSAEPASIQPTAAPPPSPAPPSAAPAPQTRPVLDAGSAAPSAPPVSSGWSDARALALGDAPSREELRAAGVPKSHGLSSALLMAAGLVITLVVFGSLSVGGFENVKAWSQGLDLDEHPSRFEQAPSSWTPPLVLPRLVTGEGALSGPSAAAAATAAPAPITAAPTVSPAAPVPAVEPPARTSAPGQPTVAPQAVPRPTPDDPSLSREEIEARYQRWLEQENLVPVDEVTLDEALSHPKNPPATP